MTLDTMVEKHLAGKSRDEIINILDKFVEEKLEPAINNRMAELAEYMNVFEPKIFFKRECHR